MATIWLLVLMTKEISQSVIGSTCRPVLTLQALPSKEIMTVIGVRLVTTPRLSGARVALASMVTTLKQEELH